jgi:predicted ArsR family transcriptional regulator
MDFPRPPDDDVLALPIRARLFEALADLRRRATTDELAELVNRHPNTVRVQLQRLADAGLLECRRVRRPQGRPRHEWAIAPDGQPTGEAPQAYGQLGRWLARVIGAGHPDLGEIQRAARRIGHELAPRPSGSVTESMRDALAALGFKPRTELQGITGVRYVLQNCPYRDAVRENQPVICTLHKGITEGLLDKLDPSARLTDFVPRDPYAAGCLIEVEGVTPSG